MTKLNSKQVGFGVVILYKVSGIRFVSKFPYEYYATRLHIDDREYPLGDKEFYDNIKDAQEVFDKVI